MIFGIGIDIIEIDRISRELSKDNGFKEKIYTSLEIETGESFDNPAKYFAGCFSAKEAFFKALGTGWRYGMTFKEIETFQENEKTLSLRVSGKAKDFINNNLIKKTCITLAITDKFAAALVVLELEDTEDR
ncbi:holo-ACP synthase [candidate division KSB1 bacterium]